jgi:hypothetical protein
MADKSEFVDTIVDATRQRYRRVMPRANKEPAAKETSRVGHWPPERVGQWRMENLTPWKIKPWKLKDWI